MNTSMLKQFKLYSPLFAPIGISSEEIKNYPIFHNLSLYTKWGNFEGYIRSFIEDEQSCNVLFETKKSIYFIDVNDILMFNTMGKLTEELKKSKIGF